MSDTEDPDPRQPSGAPPGPAGPPAPSGRAPPPNATRASRRWLLVLSFAAVYVIWSSTYLAIRIGVETLPPFLMSGGRFLLAGGVLYAVLRAAGAAARPSLSEWKHASVAGVLLLACGNGLVTWAEQRIPSNLAALLIAAVPLHMALLDWVRPGGRRPSPHVFAGIAVGFSGMVLLVAPERGGAAPAIAGAAAGVTAVLLSGLAWALGSLYARYAVRHRHPLMAAAQQMIAGGVALLGVGAPHGDFAALSLAAISLRSGLAFLYLVVFGSLVAFSAYGWLVVHSTPARLSTTAYVNPVIAVALGWVLLGETLTPKALAGAALIIGAVVVMAAGPRPLAAAARLLGLGSAPKRRGSERP